MNENFKSGFVALVGRPNVGKSTLMNHLIGQKIAITSEKPQTTRNRIQTVYTDKRGQIIFLDTPGIHKAKNKLGQYMVNVAEGTLNEVDVIMWLVEPTTYIGAGEQHIAELLSKVKTPVILAINKIDTLKKEELLAVIAVYAQAHDFEAVVPISARTGEGLDELCGILEQIIRSRRVHLEKVYPYSQAGRIQTIRKYGQLLKEEYTEDGIAVEAYVPAELFAKLYAD